MSRREVTTDEVREKYGLVIVGWDSPLQSYYAQVWAKGCQPEDNPIHEVGADLKQHFEDIKLFVIAVNELFTLTEMMQKLLWEDCNGDLDWPYPEEDPVTENASDR